MDKSRYDELRAEGGLFQERKDCAVIALAIACRTTYEAAHKALAKRGRVAGQGCFFSFTTAPAVYDLGYNLNRLENNRQKSGARFTPRTIGRAFPEGHYLCRVRNHIFAMVNGQVLDHAAGRCCRIKEIYRVTRVGRKPQVSYQE